jgi:thiosulfate/3-mercaptopyruvate sulfurtransferase
VPEPDYPEVTVTADWLAGRLDTRNVVVIDARPAASYLAGHVPGAVSFPPESVPDVASLSELARLPDVLGELGLSGREWLVCCGEVSYSREAAGLFWLLEVAGASRVVVLDGGVVGWRAAGHELVSEDVKRPSATWTRDPDQTFLATREYVRRSFGEKGVEIIDARGSDAWRGPVEPEDWGTLVRVGHIPHSLPFDFTTFFAPDGTFLGPSETWSSFAKLGPRPANPVDLSDVFVVHGWGAGSDVDFGQWGGDVWGDGPLAYFLLRRAGIAGVRLYSGGWVDWVGDPYLPIVRIVTAEELMHRLGKSRRWLRPNAPPGDFAFFDVRHPSDHRRSHIRGSVTLRSDYFADSLDVRLDYYWPDIDRETTPVVTYCYGERCIRSRASSTAAAREAFIYVERFYGGLDEWRSAGGKIVREE